MRNHGIRQQRSHAIGQMACTHDQRRARQPPCTASHYRVAAAMRIQHIETPAAQHLANGDNAFHKIDRPVHIGGVYGKALLAQALRQHGMRLADCFKMVAPVRLEEHTSEYTSLMSTSYVGI